MTGTVDGTGVTGAGGNGGARTAPNGTVPARETHTPQTLLRVAVEVFNERGYDGTSMEHLSRAAGITKSSIYHHVRGKEELLRLAVDHALEGLFAVLEEPDALRGPAVDRLEYVVRRTVEVLVERLPYVTLLLRVRGNTDTEVRALERRREFDQRVTELLRRAAAEGDLRSDVDPRLATRLVFGMVNSVAEWYRPRRGDEGAAGDPAGAEAIARAVTLTAFAGLRAGGR
ncbi:TetR/AcrR family transcriptional regulator [Streptomyces calidiresistens]|uniref:TetR family transcriptional regulator n=1 Tax=Streptomyces calidiresistens TaxID=1485586 RepID=A0A7W3XY63_9ACTN|nr:TetR/AcrR family transcriptional regulator [Streptomyces calidiresistens]MBB0231699.1 TetR family transcriptional regulator [Streptomyces calidiresistens]